MFLAGRLLILGAATASSNSRRALYNCQHTQTSNHSSLSKAKQLPFVLPDLGCADGTAVDMSPPR